MVQKGNQEEMSDFDDCDKCNRSLSEGQSMTMSIICACSSGLSVIGSSLVIFMIKRRASPFPLRNRLLLMLSTIDVIYSTALGLHKFASPPEDPWGRPTYGFGNDGTCLAQGFVIQLGTAIQGYNAMLCVYYLNAIKYSSSDSDTAKRYERFMHISASALPLCSAIGGSAADLFASNGRNCWLEAKAASSTAAMVLVLITSAFCTLQGVIITISMVMTYRAVKKTEANMQQYTYPRQRTTPSRQPPCSFCYLCRVCSSSSNEPRALVDTYRQALFYVLGFFLTLVWTGVDIAIRTICLFFHYHYQTPLFLETLITLFLPLQGFFNFLAFTWPKYVSMKRQNPQLSYFATMKKVILDTSQPISHRQLPMPTRRRNAMVPLSRQQLPTVSRLNVNTTFVSVEENSNVAPDSVQAAMQTTQSNSNSSFMIKNDIESGALDMADEDYITHKQISQPKLDNGPKETSCNLKIEDQSIVDTHIQEDAQSNLDDSVTANEVPSTDTPTEQIVPHQAQDRPELATCQSLAEGDRRDYERCNQIKKQRLQRC